MSNQYTAEQWLALVIRAAPEAFLTGSRAFGTHTDASDFDVAVMISSKSEVSKILDALFPLTRKDSDYNSGIKYDTIYGSLNIVPLHPLDFVCWKLTTKHIESIVRNCPDARARINRRETKLGIFEALTGIHKMLIQYSGAEDMEVMAGKIK